MPDAADGAAASHPLAPLLAPRSIALVGATGRPHRPGNEMVKEAVFAGFDGPIYPVSSRYEEVEGLTCHPSLADVPGPVDLAVLAVGNDRLEATLAEAIDLGVRAAVIFGSVSLPDAADSTLLQRVRAMAREVGMPICGGNCMGFYNLDAGVRAYPFHLPERLEAGGVAYFSHSGSSLSALLWNERKLRFNLAVSPGQEIVTTVADYLDYALDQPTTRAVAMLLETVRDPERFIAGLRRAWEQDVPVVVLKTGRTEESAAAALSHSGALVGSDEAYDALFDHWGVTRVYSLDELVTTTLLFSQPRRAASGGLAAIFDSGGERELLLDAAADERVPIAEIGPETTRVLSETLDHGLLPINPLDAWGTGNEYVRIFETCWQALMDDPDTAIGLFVADLTDGFFLHEEFVDICRRVAARTDKPVGFMTNHPGSTHHRLADTLVANGIPVLEGTNPALAAVRHLLTSRDYLRRPAEAAPPPPGEAVRTRWHRRLASGETLAEIEALALLGDYGLDVPASAVVDSTDDAVEAADRLGYPVAVKTAVPGILHKTDVGGVLLGLPDAEAVESACRDLAERLGPEIVVTPMIEGDVEIALGIVVDDQFGPLVMVAAGGALVETLNDRRVALPPFGAATAHRLLDGLAFRPVLDGVRGRPAVDVEALAGALARLSVMAADLGDLIAECDVNPVRVSPEGAIAVDALVIPRT